MSTPLLDQLRPSYANLWGKMTVNPNAFSDLRDTVNQIVTGIPQYLAIQAATGVHWKFIGIVHSMECSCDFGCHLANGDPLTARTVDVPAGRPIEGNPPFTFMEGAVDALEYMGLNGATDWSIEGTLFQLEKFNGMGYRKYHNINSPYLWAGSNEYTSGKYGSDGKFDQTLVSKQIGAALILKYLIDP